MSSEREYLEYQVRKGIDDSLKELAAEIISRIQDPRDLEHLSFDVCLTLNNQRTMPKYERIRAERRFLTNTPSMYRAYDYDSLARENLRMPLDSFQVYRSHAIPVLSPRGLVTIDDNGF